ncbi:hypothetical protein ACLIYP_00935 [Streptomyces nanhaiensis]|uniref:hypothetical protein n=1 Tax=Streptomyces nanhaiensis TaxID=679319 RepID=UPI00399CAC02
MAWAYAELAKEAARRGGPAALRAFYIGRGVIIGSAVTGASAVAGSVAYNKWSKRRAAAAEPASEATQEAASSERPSAPEPAQ